MKSFKKEILYNTNLNNNQNYVLGRLNKGKICTNYLHEISKIKFVNVFTTALFVF